MDIFNLFKILIILMTANVSQPTEETTPQYNKLNKLI